MQKGIIKLILGLSVVVMIGLSGCAGVPLMPESVKLKVLQSLPPANKCYIYVVRRLGFVGGGNLFDIKIDNNDYLSLATGSFYVGEFDLGKHVVGAGFVSMGQYVFDPTHSAQLTCLPGQSYYYELYGPKGFFTVLTEEEGRILINKANMVKRSNVNIQ